MAESAFDPLIHAPQRLRISAILDTASHVEFGELQERLGISKSALSKHLSHLAEAGYLVDQRIAIDGRSRLAVSLTDEGRRRYHAHRAALKEIMEAG